MRRTIDIGLWEELSDLVLRRCREIDDALGSKGWQGWSTGGMRMMTNTLLEDILSKLTIEVDQHENYPD